MALGLDELAGRFTGMRVLLAEDDKQGAKLVGMLLDKVGFAEVVHKADGAGALAAWRDRKKRFDLIISDWNMPGVTGFELLEAVRQDDRTQPFIMITGRGMLESAVDAKLAGVDAYIAKPYTPRQLLDKIVQVLLEEAADADE